MRAETFSCILQYMWMLVQCTYIRMVYELTLSDAVINESKVDITAAMCHVLCTAHLSGHTCCMGTVDMDTCNWVVSTSSLLYYQCLHKQSTQSVGWSFTDELPCTGCILHHCTLSNYVEVHNLRLGHWWTCSCGCVGVGRSVYKCVCTSVGRRPAHKEVKVKAMQTVSGSEWLNELWMCTWWIWQIVYIKWKVTRGSESRQHTPYHVICAWFDGTLWPLQPETDWK